MKATLAAVLIGLSALPLWAQTVATTAGSDLDAERFRDLARRQSIGAGLHEQAERGEPRFLGERGKRGDGVFVFHISSIVEMLGEQQLRSCQRRINSA